MRAANVTVENQGNVLSFNKLVGIARMKFVGLNPDLKRKQELGFKKLPEEPTYIIEQDGTKRLKLEFFFQINDTYNEKGHTIDQVGKGQIVSATLWVDSDLRKESQAGKVQIIDKYGNSAWATKEEFSAKQVPCDRNGRPLTIDSKYYRTFNGEAELIDFLRTLMSFRKSTEWVENESRYVMSKNPDVLKEAEISFDCRNKFMSGDLMSIVKELKDALAGDLVVRGCLGIRQSGDKEYQSMIPVLDGINNWKNSNIKAYLASNTQKLESWIIDSEEVHEHTQARVVADEIDVFKSDDDEPDFLK